jgi:hypothetical protein
MGSRFLQEKCIDPHVAPLKTGGTPQGDTFTGLRLGYTNFGAALIRKADSSLAALTE